jgi:DNA-binding HxlR family transcriptional regulator
MSRTAAPEPGRPELPGRPCSIASALALVGEKWALLAVREISLGNHRFDAIARNTGAPRDRLAARLRALATSGIVERRQYSDRPPRFEYYLTDAGLDLRAVLQAVRGWGDKWAVERPPARFTHATCGHRLAPVVVCRHCGTEVTGDDIRLRPTSSGWTRSGPVDG